MSAAPSAARDVRAEPRYRLADAVIAGFVATGASTFALVVAYIAAEALGDPRGFGPAGWLWQLSNNQVVSFVRGLPAIALGLHIFAGLFWAMLYARLFEPRLGGPGWRKGLMFAAVPWLVTLLALVPAAMVGLLGALLSAGPLPPIGNLLLHLVYGVVLGALYDRSAETADMAEGAEVDAEQAHAAAESSGFAAAGIISGIVVGAFVGLGLAFLLPTQTAADGTQGWPIGLAIGGLLAGGAVGAVVGSFAGLPQAPENEEIESRLGPDVVERNISAFLIPIGVLVFIAFCIVSFGSFLLTTRAAYAAATHDEPVARLVPVVVSTVAAFVVAVVAWVMDARQARRSSRATVSHRGH